MEIINDRVPVGATLFHLKTSLHKEGHAVSAPAHLPSMGQRRGDSEAVRSTAIHGTGGKLDVSSFLADKASSFSKRFEMNMEMQIR